MTFKKISTLILFLFTFFPARSQQWEVIKFEEKTLDFSAKKYEKTSDGIPCALIKLSIPTDNVIFKSSTITGIPERKDGYWWIYVLEDAKEIRVVANNNEVLEIEFNKYKVSIKGRTTYILQIEQKIFVRPPKPLITGIQDVNWITGFNSGSICGDYFGFYTEVKLGNPNGIGFEFGYAPGHDNWTIGIKGYKKGGFLSVNYGTTLPIYGKELSGDVKPDGTIIKDGNRNYGKYGFNFLIGYDKSFKWFHLEIGAGLIIPTKNTKIFPAWTIGVGVDILRLKKWQM